MFYHAIFKKKTQEAMELFHRLEDFEALSASQTNFLGKGRFITFWMIFQLFY
jgi:hypothetical protein